MKHKIRREDIEADKAIPRSQKALILDLFHRPYLPQENAPEHLTATFSIARYINRRVEIPPGIDLILRHQTGKFYHLNPDIFEAPALTVQLRRLGAGKLFGKDQRILIDLVHSNPYLTFLQLHGMLSDPSGRRINPTSKARGKPLSRRMLIERIRYMNKYGRELGIGNIIENVGSSRAPRLALSKKFRLMFGYIPAPKNDALLLGEKEQKAFDFLARNNGQWLNEMAESLGFRRSELLLIMRRVIKKLPRANSVPAVISTKIGGLRHFRLSEAYAADSSLPLSYRPHGFFTKEELQLIGMGIDDPSASLPEMARKAGIRVQLARERISRIHQRMAAYGYKVRNRNGRVEYLEFPEGILERFGRFGRKFSLRGRPAVNGGASGGHLGIPLGSYLNR